MHPDACSFTTPTDEQAADLLDLIKRWSTESDGEALGFSMRALNDLAGKAAAIAGDSLLAEQDGAQVGLNRKIAALGRAGELLRSAQSCGQALAYLVERLRNDLSTLQSECWQANEFSKDLAKRGSGLGEYMGNEINRPRFLSLLDKVIEERARSRTRLENLEAELNVTQKKLEKADAEVVTLLARLPPPSPETA